MADESVGVIVFAKGANGNAEPVATITGISYATGVVADAKDHIYVADFTGRTVPANAPSDAKRATAGYGRLISQGAGPSWYELSHGCPESRS